MVVCDVCLYDKRLDGLLGIQKTQRDFIVPGFYYDEVIEGIFDERKRSGSEVFSALNPDVHVTVPENDHEPEMGENESASSAHVVILIMMFALIVVVVQARLLPHFPLAISTLLTGIGFAIAYRFTSKSGSHGDHFMNLDSEYIIFGFTPILILGEIMRLDVRMAKRLILQFLFYGLVGGLINTLMTTGLLTLTLPASWQFELLLSIAAVVSTTDASFLSATLSKVGVSERILILLEGESVNDPPLFAVLTLAKELYTRTHSQTGETLPSVDALEAMAICARLILSGVALGAISGIVCLGLISFTSSRFMAENEILQITITLVCCYSTFFLAESIFQMSGALAVVTAGWVLAARMWPKLICQASMITFWKTIDFISEAFLYLVVGFYVGIEAFRVDFFKCIGYSFLVWGISQLCRFVSLFVLSPIINLLGPKLNWRELLLWGCCGLKGRVGLALIIEFSIHLLDKSEHAQIRSEVVFVVGVVFFISNVINGGLGAFFARCLKLDQANDVETKVKSILFKYAIANSIKSQLALGPYLHHTIKFCEEGSIGSEETSKTGMVPIPSDLGIDWATVDTNELVDALKSIYVSIIKSLYWKENEDSKDNTASIQNLLSAADRTLEEDSTGLSDFYHIMVILPSRATKQNQYEVLYILTTFAECHITAREIVDEDLLKAVSDSGISSADMKNKLETAWDVIRKESRKAELQAKRELTVRFDEATIREYIHLRELNLTKLKKVFQDFEEWKLLSEKDLEASHDAFFEDLDHIQSAMRSIGTGDHSANAPDDDAVDNEEHVPLAINQ